MSDEGNGMLIRLSDSGYTVADPAQDVRGRPVLDESGAKLGTVEDLLVESQRPRVRFLRVVRGGVLGWGATPCYVAADAVVYAGASVLVRTSGDISPRATGYDPRLTPEPTDGGVGYDHPAYASYWLRGYLPPVNRTWHRFR